MHLFGRTEPFIFRHLVSKARELAYNGSMTKKKEETVHPSALFGYDDQAYELHIRSSIAVLDKVVASGEDILVEAPMATRVLLDFYYETLRRYLIWKNK